jgi:hypothetical protein
LCSGECDAGYYCLSGSNSSQAYRCPLYFTSPAGSTSYSNCSCIIGYSRANNSSDSECIAVGIVSGSLRVLNGAFNVSNDGSLLFLMNGGNSVTFAVTGNWILATNQSNPSIGQVMFTFGSSTSPQQYQCSSITRQMINDTYSTMECELPFAYAQNVSFHMYLISNNGSLVSLPTNSSYSRINDIFSYPVPTITPVTLRLSRFPSSDGVAKLVAATNYLQESLSFDGQYFVNDSQLLSIYYGPVTEPTQFQCMMDESKTTSTTITCTTESSRGMQQVPSFNIDIHSVCHN